MAEASAPDLRRLLNPTSLAVVGDARLGARVLRQTRALGFAGPTWAVHPSGQVGSEPALTSVADLPGSPDAAFVAVPAALAPGVLGKLRDRGCGSAVVYSSGFAETGAAGLVLQQRLLEAADGMPILGPNCYGLLDYVDGVAIWPDEHGGQRLPAGGHGVAVVSQSSSMAISMTMQDIGLPLAHVLTVGNGAAVGPWQLAEALTAQPRVSAVGLVVESLHDLIGIEALARSSRATSTPVVVLLLGRSEQAQRVVLSHSASMASDAEVGAGFLARCGLGQVDSVDSLLGALALLHCGGPLAGPRLTSLSSSGGEAALVADACVGRRVGFGELSPTHRAALAAALGPRVTLDNPLDYHTYVWGDLTAMRAAFVAMTGGPGDLHLLFSDMPREDRCDPTDWLLAVQAFREALEETGARGALVAAMGSNLRGPRPASWIERGLPVLAPVRVAIDAAQAAADVGAAWTRAVPEPVWGRASVESSCMLTAKPPIKPASVETESVETESTKTESIQQLGARVVDEPTAKRLLAGYGAHIPVGGVACSVAEAVEMFGELVDQGRAAVAVKGVGAAHKTDLDGVRLGLRTSQDVASAATDLLRRFDTVLVEELIDGAVAELLLSVDLDPTFGPVLTLGWGGTRTELHADVCRLVLPSERDQIRTALLGLRCAPLLTGYRGAPAGDLEAVLDAVEATVAAATTDGSRSIEINPLLVTPHGAWVADALVMEFGQLTSPIPQVARPQQGGSRAR